MEMYGHDVNDKSMKVKGGQQRITTPDGFCIPLNIKKGLPYMTLRPYTDDEWNDLPHVVLTGDTDWDPSVLDNEIDDDENWFDVVSDFTDANSNQLFDLWGNYRHRHTVHCIDINSPHLEDGILPTCPQLFDVYDAEITKQSGKLLLRNQNIHHTFQILHGSLLRLLRGHLKLQHSTFDCL